MPGACLSVVELIIFMSYLSRYAKCMPDTYPQNEFTFLIRAQNEDILGPYQERELICHSPEITIRDHFHSAGTQPS